MTAIRFAMTPGGYRADRSWPFGLGIVLLLHVALVFAVLKGSLLQIPCSHMLRGICHDNHPTVVTTVPEPKVEPLPIPVLPTKTVIPTHVQVDPTRGLRIPPIIVDPGTVESGGDTVSIDPPTLPPSTAHTPVRVGAQIDLVHSARPDYPPAARRLGKEGTVRVAVHVGAQGNVLDVALSQSSGSAILDDAAMSGIKRHYRFNAGLMDGAPTDMWTEVAVTFRLTDP